MAKNQDDTPKVDEAAKLAEENAALRGQQNEMLDLLAELSAKVDALEAAGTAKSDAPKVSEEEKQLMAELSAIKEEFKDFPGIDVFEQSVLEGSDADPGIRLVGDPTPLQETDVEKTYWKLRWFNFAEPGRADRAARRNYVKVTFSELQTAESIVMPPDAPKDGFVRRGDRGLEVLCKVPRKMYNFRRKMEAARLQGVLTSESKLRDHLSGNVAHMAGKRGMNADQAGSHIHSQKDFTVSITKGETDSLTMG